MKEIKSVVTIVITQHYERKRRFNLYFKYIYIFLKEYYQRFF